MMFKKFLSLFLKPKSGNYHDVIKVTPNNVGSTATPITSVYLIKQPKSEETIGLRIEYKMPKGCKAHHAQFRTLDTHGDVSTILWLLVGEIEDDGTYYMMNTLDRNLCNKGILLFRFSDEKYPVCNYYSYEIFLSDFEIS